MSFQEKEISKKLKTDPTVMGTAEERTVYVSGTNSDGQDGDDELKTDPAVMGTEEGKTNSDGQDGDDELKTYPAVMGTAEGKTVYVSGTNSDGQEGDDEFSEAEDTADASGSDCDEPAGDVELKTDDVAEEIPEEATDYDSHSSDGMGTGDEFKSGYCFTLATCESDSDIGEDVLKQFEIYRQELRKYKGFRVENVPNVPFFGAIQEIDVDGDHAPYLLKSTQFAIKKNNRKDSPKLELVKILRANMKACGGFEYFITFEAKDSSSGETVTYQTQVYFSSEAFHRKNGMRVIKFRRGEIVDQSS